MPASYTWSRSTGGYSHTMLARFVVAIVLILLPDAALAQRRNPAGFTLTALGHTCHALALLRRSFLCLLFLLFFGRISVFAAEVSTLQAGEAVVLFPSAGHQSEDGRHWVVPLQAWVYVPQHSHQRRKAIAELLKQRHGLDLTPANAAFFDPRINLLLADNKRGRTIVVEVLGVRAALPPTSANGHSQGQVRIPVSADTPEGTRVTLRAVLTPIDSRTIEATAHLVGRAGLSVISDIDDTVKITHVRDRRMLWEATFYKSFEAVPGMPDAYQRLAAKGAAFHYVSSSPWHLAEPLLAFLGASGFAVSSISLKHVRLKDRTALNILKPGRETKPPAIEAILTRYPERRFILIGDSGEDDPEVYAEALRNHPKQIARIFIRNITGARRTDDRFTKAFAGLDAERWVLFEDAAAVGDQ
jgi:Phosphatidate phosphatase APP1, catalytic domain